MFWINSSLFKHGMPIPSGSNLQYRIQHSMCNIRSFHAQILNDQQSLEPS
jgi:hypothetical protein